MFMQHIGLINHLGMIGNEKKEAELLFKDEIPPQFIVGFLVYSEKALEKMISFGIPKEKIIVKPEYYY